MQFNHDNKVFKLCADGMAAEGAGDKPEAAALFGQAWNEAATDQEKFTAAHYVARHQPDPQSKLNWDQTALEFALKIDDPGMKAHLPSLYLNIGKCYEDMRQAANAIQNYQQALSFSEFLPDDGYGKMILSGINNGLQRLAEKQ